MQLQIQCEPEWWRRDDIGHPDGRDIRSYDGSGDATHIEISQ